MKLDRKRRRKRVEAALGKLPCDLILRNATYLDVFALEWRKGDIAIYDGAIVGLDPGLRAERELNLQGKSVVPGFIDAHVHVESSMLSPGNFERAVLPRGTTTAVCDPHELANVQGISGIKYFLESAESLSLDLRVMLSSCVPATDFETNGAGHLPAAKLLPLRKHPQALGLAEMMNVPGVLHGDKEVWDKLDAFGGEIVDGHCPLLSGHALSAYATAGISSCHESTRLEEAREKLTKGLAVWIREGSVAKDLDTLAPLLTVASSARIGFCTDDRNPLDIAREGHIDFLVRGAIAKGVSLEAAYRSASWTVARHYGLTDRGAVAPGLRADLLILGDRKSCAVERVLCAGDCVDEMDLGRVKKKKFPNSVDAKPPEPKDLLGPSGRVHAIGVQAGKILTEKRVRNHDDRDVARLTVLERYGHRRKPANAYVVGFGERFRGAIASSVGHDSHNLIVVGKDTKDMAVALAALIDSGGGYCVVENGAVASLLPLPLGGLMSDQPGEAIEKKLAEMRAVCRGLQCELEEPFLQLAFLSLPVIPSLKLTDRGLIDVDAFKPISVRAS